MLRAIRGLKDSTFQWLSCMPGAERQPVARRAARTKAVRERRGLMGSLE